MELSYEQYAELMDELVSEGHDVLDASEMIFSGQLNEEQVWEEVETWVNSLLEEGHDLSEYTWEEMYEAYIAEYAAGSVPAPAKYKSSSDGKTYANYNDALAAKNSRMKGLAVQQGIQKTFKAGGGNAAVAQGKSPLAVVTQGSTNLQRQQRPAPAAAPAARPAAAAPATKPAPAAARPAVPASAPTKPAVPTGTTAGGTTFQRRAATGAELRAAQAARAAGKGEEGAIKAGVEAGKSTPSRNGFGASTAPMAAQSSVSSTTSPTGFSLAKTNKQKITAGMEIQGDRLQEQLRVDNYGGSARPDSLLDAYQAIYNQ